jgi:hypothetical protein
MDVRNVLGKGPADAKLEELYELDKQIGKGAFGVVRLGRAKATGEPLAVKSISKAKLTCKEDVKDVQAEVAIMNLVAGHQNVVTLEVRVAGRVCVCVWAGVSGRVLGWAAWSGRDTRARHTSCACLCRAAATRCTPAGPMPHTHTHTEHARGQGIRAHRDGAVPGRGAV